MHLLILLLAAVSSTDGLSVFPLAEERRARGGAAPGMWLLASLWLCAQELCCVHRVFPASSQHCSIWRERQSDGPHSSPIDPKPCKWKNFKSWRRAEREKAGPSHWLLCCFSPSVSPPHTQACFAVLSLLASWVTVQLLSEPSQSCSAFSLALVLKPGKGPRTTLDLFIEAFKGQVWLTKHLYGPLSFPPPRGPHSPRAPCRLRAKPGTSMAVPSTQMRPMGDAPWEATPCSSAPADSLLAEFTSFQSRVERPTLPQPSAWHGRSLLLPGMEPTIKEGGMVEGWAEEAHALISYRNHRAPGKASDRIRACHTPSDQHPGLLF